MQPLFLDCLWQNKKRLKVPAEQTEKDDTQCFRSSAENFAPGGQRVLDARANASTDEIRLAFLFFFRSLSAMRMRRSVDDLLFLCVSYLLFYCFPFFFGSVRCSAARKYHFLVALSETLHPNIQFAAVSSFLKKKLSCHPAVISLRFRFFPNQS